MAQQSKASFIKDVALRMDEISSSDEVSVSVGITDNNPLYELIGGLIEEAFGEVARIAPIPMLPVDDEEGTAENGITTISLPSDYLRFGYITVAGSNRVIVTLNVEGDSVAVRQDNKYTRAGSEKPVAVLSGATAGPAIRVYGGTGATLYYIAKSTHINGTSVSYSTESENEIAKWITAEKVFAAMGDANRAQLCKARVDALIQ